MERRVLASERNRERNDRVVILVKIDIFCNIHEHAVDDSESFRYDNVIQLDFYFKRQM